MAIAIAVFVRDPTLCARTQPNRAAHPDAREAARLVGLSPARAGGRERYASR